MNAVTAVEASAVRNTISQAALNALLAGDPLGGGFYAGQIRQGEDIYALVVAPKDGGEHDDIVWNGDRSRVEGALSYSDGAANTAAMAVAGSDLAKWAIGLQINGYHDWHLPARDEAEIIYRNLKPTAGNYASFRDGENPSSVPVGYPYTEQLPAQTGAAAFQAGGSEAFEEAWYWTSTQYAGTSHGAWYQYFLDGNQYGHHKNYEFRARAVRRFLVTQ
ncbi:DUF1566 domain-containing protein [Cupriavidus sp. CV2]|uniref:Lcl C-terminal domain-containing protein n=1 Tax=Cupriavidus ulmosensis TaxID=3065913 RepID=UPI00296AA3DD|nr:DUF1566 domain-containing protein [Cupriavidus sp. CV2]MDW3683903.1 DUF1566 domain-containing protein [Cupriavidus sp. CV2]